MTRTALRLVALAGAPARALEAELVENPDGTVDLNGVEILAVGGPIHGVGSPPEGDFWTLEELRGMAQAAAELGDELLPPNKVGHPDEQTLVANSIAAGEIAIPAEGELPAAGWLENERVEGTMLVGDIKRIPRILAEAIKVGAYRTRSVELSKVTSQRTGKSYDWVVTGLAWLGGKMPAVRTLGDVVALYEGDVPIRRRAVVLEERALAAGDVAWSPDEGLEHLRAIVNDALNPGPANPDAPVRYWVRDVAPGKALVEDWNEEPGVAWIVPFSVTEGVVELAASGDWTRAEEAWVEVGRANEERALTFRAQRADTGAMKFSADQRRKFAEATGLAEADVTDKMLEDAGVAPADEPKPDDEPKPEPAPQDDPDSQDGDTGRELEALKARLTALETEGTQERRRSFAADAVKARKIAPGQRADLEKLYERDPAAAEAFVKGLPVRNDLDGELGDDGDDSRSLEEAAEKAYADDASARLGIAKEALV